MGKTKQKYNWKARVVPETKIDRTNERKIKIDPKIAESSQNFDDANPLVLPSEKRKTKLKLPAVGTKKLLSKRKRKELEKVVERKKKKENRAALLESIAKVQLPSEVLAKYTSITEVQTKGLKRRYNEDDWAKKIDIDSLKVSTVEDKESLTKLNSLKGSGKRRRLLAAMYPVQKKSKISDPNIVTFEESSDDISSDEGDLEEHQFDISNVKIEEDASQTVADEEQIADNNCDSNGLLNGSTTLPSDNGNLGTDKVVEENVNGVNDGCQKAVASNWETVNFDIPSPQKRCQRSASKVKKKPEFQVTVIETDKKEGKVLASSSERCSSGEMEELNKLKNESSKQSPAEKDSAKPDKAPTLTVWKKGATYVTVERHKEIQEARLKLPILAEEQVIMETINENQIVIIAGETGSGKTTQVPQFLYEAGYTKNGKIIGVTEPRRVAAISMSKRVGEELNLGTDKVSFLIRFEGNVTPETEIKFMTDGVLLKEIQADFLLTKYSVIILDEAHERSVYTDILMGLLSRIVPLRHKRADPLKLIVMSATLRVEDFIENKHLFKNPPPVIKVESRQFPVTIHFNKKTDPDYLREAYKKVCRIHTQLPDGGILVFLTGQQEVNTLVKKLRKVFPMKNRAIVKKNSANEDEKVEDEDDLDVNMALQKIKKKKEVILPHIDLDDYSVAPNDDTEIDLFDDLNAENDDDWDDENAEMMFRNAQPMWVLPLYSILPSYKQAKVFAPPPEGTRLCIVATNVAETSLTIPGVKFVVDSGKVKTKLYDKLTGVTAFDVAWTSKAAANQRAGRAGRTGPGHCYRLYSSAVFNDNFEGWSVPEMQRRPVEDLVLQMKSLGIQRVVNFPFPSPPDQTQLRIAEEKLTLLGALQPSTSKRVSDKEEFNGKLTRLGESMARFPVAPRFAKMLCLSHQHGLLEYTVAIVAAMSVQEVLLEAEKQGARLSRAKWAGQGNSLLLGDAMILLRAVGAAEYANSQNKLEEFCNQNNIRQKAIIEVRKIRLQLTNEINLLNRELNLIVNPQMPPPDVIQARLLRQIVLAGLIDRVARKTDEEFITAKGKRKPLYNTPEMENLVLIHSSSALAKSCPDWVVYQEIYETNEKTYIRGITAIEPEWLPVFALPLCHMSPPLEDPPPRYDDNEGIVKCRMSGTFGRSGWELPLVEMEYPTGLDKYRWFAVFFLNGSVCPKLKQYQDSLLSSPQTMTKSWAKLQSRTEFLLKTLASKEVDSRSKLYEVWKSEPRYLLSAFLKWLPETMENELSILWPPKDGD